MSMFAAAPKRGPAAPTSSSDKYEELIAKAKRSVKIAVPILMWEIKRLSEIIHAVSADEQPPPLTIPAYGAAATADAGAEDDQPQTGAIVEEEIVEDLFDLEDEEESDASSDAAIAEVMPDVGAEAAESEISGTEAARTGDQIGRLPPIRLKAEDPVESALRMSAEASAAYRDAASTTTADAEAVEPDVPEGDWYAKAHEQFVGSHEGDDSQEDTQRGSTASLPAQAVEAEDFEQILAEVQNREGDGETDWLITFQPDDTEEETSFVQSSMEGHKGSARTSAD